jgi:putative membrane protein
MRTLLKHFILDTIALYLISETIRGMEFTEGYYTLFLAGFVLMVATMVIKPVITLLLLPLNMITLGLFKWVTFAITFYLVTLIVPGFVIKDFVFGGYNSYWFSLPPISFTGIFAFLSFAFLISFTSSLLRWIFK